MKKTSNKLDESNQEKVLNLPAAHYKGEGLKIALSSKFCEKLKEADVILANADILDFIRAIPSNLVSLVITSPPYNIGKPYEQKMEFENYLNWQKDVLKECIRILRDDGSICWEIGNYIESKE